MATHDMIAASGLLVVGVPRPQLPPQIEQHCDSAGIELTCAADVYRALARISRQPPVAVLVAIDWLTTAEMEFFELLNRRHSGLRVFACGQPRAHAKLARAAGTGATRLETLEDIVGHLACSEAEAAPAAPPADEKSREVAAAHNVFDAELERRLRELVETGGAAVKSAPADAGIPDASVPNDAGGRLAELDSPAERTYEVVGEDIGPPASPVADDSNIGLPARVPWRRYEGGPARTPPRIRPQESPGGAAEDGPLLTPEELDALLGDDDFGGGTDWGPTK